MKTSKLNLFIVAAFTALLISCSSGMSGTYAGKENAFLDKITFTSGNKVEVTAMGGTKSGTFQKEGDKVTISVAGDNQVFTIDKEGCLDGGAIVGRYCKE